ncbi:hypothetical protein TrLO_g9499 [Triparma laevis f. longispina]|uniref:Uncharacterized protein n=1 Tax=Triparma laevis f. longispina TaxID=1714387 RepID=A0A9W6ZBM2_9STRA|nr:hypothetical protein TrLO_g9499 [Triparma laevis f. longispina]
MSSREGDLPPQPPTNPGHVSVNPEGGIPAPDTRPRRERLVKSSSVFIAFDSRPKEPGEIDVKDFHNLQVFLVSKGGMVEEQIAEEWATPLLPNAIKTVLKKEGYLPATSSRWTRGKNSRPVPMGNFAMDKTTTIGLQKYLNANKVGIEAKPDLELDGLFGPVTVETMRKFIDKWADEETGGEVLLPHESEESEEGEE